MTFLHRGKGRRGVAALATAGALMAFQALSIVGASVASAAGTCTFNPATNAVSITVTGGTTSTLQVDDGTVVAAGDILFDGAACGSATNSNTTSITVLGQPSTAETLDIDAATYDVDFNPAITWAIDLGTGITDVLQFDASTDGVSLVFTNTTFALNGGTAGPALGVETFNVVGNTGDDSVDGSALTTPVVTFTGGAGDDWLAPGIPTDGDSFTGGLGTDTVSYGTASAAQCIAIDDSIAAGSGLDVNCDGDAVDASDATDTLVDCIEVLESGAGNDTLTSCSGVDETFVPGDGDDDITGTATDDDFLDYSSSSAAMTIDPTAGTAVGQGSDTFTGITGFIGSAFDDILIWDGSTTEFSGGDGVDTVDASAETTAQQINLGGGLAGQCGGAPPFTPGDDVENVTGGSGGDTICGNIVANVLLGGDGNDTLLGFGGNDWIEGGLGNDNMDGGTGADTLSFKNAPSGEEIDNQLGFATGGDGDDSIAFFEILLGSNFADTIRTGQNSVGLNQRVKGRGGNDDIVGSNSSDLLLGGGGNDTIRAGGGDDTLKGAKGNDLLVGGQGFDLGFGGKGRDTCRGVEQKHSC